MIPQSAIKDHQFSIILSSPERSFELYKCSKCNVYCEVVININKYPNPANFLSGWIIKLKGFHYYFPKSNCLDLNLYDLSCDEIIIKNIIE
jgi:hypothetical protein